MGNMAYCKINLAESGTISVSSENAFYPKGNLVNGRPSKPFRTTDHTAEWIKVDLGSAKVIKFVGLLNHNLSSGATITIEGNATDSWATPTYTATMTWVVANCFKIINQEFRWWRVTIADAGNTDGYIQIGQWLVGTHTVLTHNWHYGSSTSISYNNIRLMTAYKQEWVYALNSGTSYYLNFEYVTAADRAEYDTLFILTQGGFYPFLLIPDIDVAACYWGKIQDVYQYGMQGFGVYSTSILFTELPNGVIVN